MVKGEFLSFYFIIPSRGLRFYKARMMRGKGPTPNVIFERDGFKLYRCKGGLRLRVPTGSGRRLRRFLRDYVKSRGGRPNTVKYWFTSR